MLKSSSSHEQVEVDHECIHGTDIQDWFRQWVPFIHDWEQEEFLHQHFE